MNKDHVLFHLREARAALDATIREIEGEANYDYPEFVVDMTHLFHHVNTAWNSRDASPERCERCFEEDFSAWRQFPKDLDMCT